MSKLIDKIDQAREDAANARRTPPSEAEILAEQEVRKAASSTAAQGVVEAFKARTEGREPNYDNLDRVRPDKGGKPPREEPEVLSVERDTANGRKAKLTFQSVTYDERGIVEVHATSELDGNVVPLDLPIYLVNPPTLVEDDAGDIEVQIGEDRGKPVVKKFREDPVEAVARIIIDDLVVGGD